MDKIFGFIRWVIGFLITIIVAIFAVMNRNDVDVFWNPVASDQSMTLPIYALIMGCMAFGFIMGSLIVWFNMSGLRKERRRQKREIKSLEKEMKRLQDVQADPPHDIESTYSVLKIK